MYSVHQAWAYFYYWELVYCPECYGYGDYFGYSLLSTGSFESDTWISPPGYLVESQDTLTYTGYIQKHRATQCILPSETTAFVEWGPPGDFRYVGGFVGSLSGGSFDSKALRELVLAYYPFRFTSPYPHSDGCYYSGSPIAPVTRTDFEGAWYVGTIANFLGQSYSSSNKYGYDAIGLKASGSVMQHYKPRMQAQGQSCEIWLHQYMQYDCRHPSGNDWRTYQTNKAGVTSFL